MQGSAQMKRRAAQDFDACYESLCATQGLAPVAAVRLGLSQGVLDFNGDAISFPDWAPILSALSVNKQLHHVSVRSCYLSSLGSQGVQSNNHLFNCKKQKRIYIYCLI